MSFGIDFQCEGLTTLSHCNLLITTVTLSDFYWISLFENGSKGWLKIVHNTKLFEILQHSFYVNVDYASEIAACSIDFFFFFSYLLADIFKVFVCPVSVSQSK